MSIDKDFQTLPCRVFNPRKKVRPKIVTLRQANYNWFYQTILGDTSDNYKGAPGAGAAAARQALMPARGLGGLTRAALEVFEQKFDRPAWRPKFVWDHPFDEFLMNARCARIMRHGDYRLSPPSARLWGPTQATDDWIALERRTI